MAEFDPSLPFQLAVTGADGVGMKVKAPGQFARAGQALAGRKVVAQDGENDLRDQLLPDGDFARAGKPELHRDYLTAVASPGFTVWWSTRGRVALETAGGTPSLRSCWLIFLLLLLFLHVLFDFGQDLAVVFGAGIHGIEGVGEHKLVLLGFLGIGVDGTF
jgi:hypothetical protein